MPHNQNLMLVMRKFFAITLSWSDCLTTQSEISLTVLGGACLTERSTKFRENKDTAAFTNLNQETIGKEILKSCGGRG